MLLGGLAMDEEDALILAAVQEGLPITERPFQALGRALEMSETEVLLRLTRMRELGLVRRIGPILDLKKLGLGGVLVALKVTAGEADEAALVVNEYPEVSHNYLRPNPSGYNLWFTVSARDERIEEILKEIEAKTGLKQLVLPTVRIFKIGVKFDVL
jgi:DNA-binding Lrp family transcriptional regulator